MLMVYVNKKVKMPAQPPKKDGEKAAKKAKQKK